MTKCHKMPKQVPEVGARTVGKSMSRRDRPPAIDLQDFCHDHACQSQRPGTAKKSAVRGGVSRYYSRPLGRFALADMAAPVNGSLVQAADIVFPHARLQGRPSQA